MSVPKQQGEAALGPTVGVAPQAPTARGCPGLLALLVRDGGLLILARLKGNQQPKVVLKHVHLVAFGA
eukprot:8892458-Lingulodinium_polyedra.AAC.1